MKYMILKEDKIMDKYFKKEEVVNGYSILNVIGQGRYGIAYLAIDENGKKCVVKQLKKEMLEETRKKLKFEENILKVLDNPKFPKFISKFVDTKREGYLLEYIEGRVLYDYLSEDEHEFTREEIYEIAEKLVDLVYLLQSNNIVHRDIRLPNIIVKENKELVLIDFGLARFIDNKRYLKKEDYWYVADSLIDLYYSRYRGNNANDRPWYEELALTDEERRFLKKLMGISGEYESIAEIKSDLEKIKDSYRRYNELFTSITKEEKSVLSSSYIYKIYPESLMVNQYGTHPFRLIALIDVDIIYEKSIERVTLGFYRSSGTNGGKIEGYWYPIVGIKTRSGPFVEFTRFLNYALEFCTTDGMAPRGWLAKSIFFYDHDNGNMIRGYSDSRYNKALFKIGKIIRKLYENGEYRREPLLKPGRYNELLTSDRVYDGNENSQRYNFESFIKDIFFTR